MKIIWLIAFIGIVLSALVFFAGQLGLLTGTAPKDLGVKNGRFKPPSITPNSVSSQASLYPDHPQREYAEIAPFHYFGDATAAMHKLGAILETIPRTNVVTKTDIYLYAQCSTQVLKFTDDLEFWLDTDARVIHVRSASRIGRKDFGTNRIRVEKIRAQFEQN